MLLSLAGHASRINPIPFLIDNQEACRYNVFRKAGVAQLVEYKLPKLGVAGSRPVARSIFLLIIRGFISRIFCLSESATMSRISRTFKLSYWRVISRLLFRARGEPVQGNTCIELLRSDEMMRNVIEIDVWHLGFATTLLPYISFCRSEKVCK